MANKYTRKGRERGNAPPEAQAEDQFVSLSARGWNAIEPYLRQIGYGLAGAAVLIAALWGAMKVWSGAQEDATEMFGRAVRIYDSELLPADDKPKTPPAEDETPRFKTAKERADATLAVLDQIDKAHGSSKVNREALALRAGVLYDQGNYPEAEKDWRKVADAADGDNPMKVVAREGVGLALENQGKLDDALGIYKDIESAGGGFFKDQSQFDQARVLAAKGQKADAEKLWDELRKRVPAGGLHDEIENRLAALKG